MAILVDYRCPACGVKAEHWQPAPPPASVPCASCGAEARRLFAAVGLSGSRAAAPPTQATSARRDPSLCRQFPQIPGLCHMSESAGRMWVAKYLKDGRAIDREQQRQEEAAAVKAPVLSDAISHQHAEPAPATTPAPTAS